MTESAEAGAAGREVQIREYIHRALFAANLDSSADLIREREVVLGRSLPKTLAHSRDSAEFLQQREANKQRIEKCRTGFWDLTHDQLIEIIDLGSLCQDADLHFSAERLIHVSTLRNDFIALEHRMGSMNRILRVLKALVVLTPREAAGYREAELRAMRDSKIQKEMKQGAKRIREEFPDIFALESFWIAEVEENQRVSNRAQTFRQAEASGGSSVAWIWLAIVIGGVIVRAIIRASRGD